jgi:hypothetical protein
MCVLACSGSDRGPVGPGSTKPPASLQIASGSNQTGAVATPLALPLVVHVRDAGGAAVAGATVQWSTGSGTVDPAASTTDATGAATTTWTLGTTAGAMTATAALGSLSAEFRATANPGRIASVRVTGDSVVLGTWGEVATLAAQASDRYGNAVNGVTFAWSSSDTSIALVDATGRVTSGKSGVATISVRADTIQGQGRAVVLLQRNPRCIVPGRVTPRGPAAAPSAFQRELTQRFPAHPMDFGGNDVVVFDYDGDGRQDVLLFNSQYAGEPGPGGRMFLFRNTGSAFADVTAAVLGNSPPTPSYTQALEIADFNGDGRPDVFGGQSGYDQNPFPGARNFLFLTTPGGGLAEVGSTSLSPNPVSFTHGATSGDLDCDGDVDIVEVDIRAGSRMPGVRVQVNSGNGTFTDRAADMLPNDLISSTRHNGPFLSVGACDLDRDGDQDLVGGGWFLPPNREPDILFINDGFGHYRRSSRALPAPIYGVGTNVVDIRCADFDNDGWNDLVLTVIQKSPANSDAGGRTVFWRNNGNMTFTDVTTTVAPSTWPGTTYPIKSYVRDFNGDGWPDVLTTGYGDPWNGWWTSGQGGNAIFFNDGRGGFVRVAMENWWGPLWPIDVNGDGKLDLLWAGAYRTTSAADQQIYVQR